VTNTEKALRLLLAAVDEYERLTQLVYGAVAESMVEGARVPSDAQSEALGTAVTFYNGTLAQARCHGMAWCAVDMVPRQFASRCPSCLPGGNGHADLVAFAELRGLPL
jgi:hypothetical protein